MCLDVSFKKRKTLLYKERQWHRWRQAGDETLVMKLNWNLSLNIEIMLKSLQNRWMSLKKHVSLQARFSPGTLKLPCCKLLEYYMHCVPGLLNFEVTQTMSLNKY